MGVDRHLQMLNIYIYYFNIYYQACQACRSRIRRIRRISKTISGSALIYPPGYLLSKPLSASGRMADPAYLIRDIRSAAEPYSRVDTVFFKSPETCAKLPFSGPPVPQNTNLLISRRKLDRFASSKFLNSCLDCAVPIVT